LIDSTALTAAMRLSKFNLTRGRFLSWSFMPVTGSSSPTGTLVSNGPSKPRMIRGIDAKITADESGTLAFSYTLSADMDQLMIPCATAHGRVDGLWQHSCFEAFFGMKDCSAYYELNFSPSGQWAAYRFRAYRERRPIEVELSAPAISVEQTADRLTLTAAVRLDQLPALEPGAIIRIGLSAVIEDIDGALSYWALKHPSEQPDFHHPGSFAWEFALPGKSA